MKYNVIKTWQVSLFENLSENYYYFLSLRVEKGREKRERERESKNTHSVFFSPNFRRVYVCLCNRLNTRRNRVDFLHFSKVFGELLERV